jgi:hypothetical protein
MVNTASAQALYSQNFDADDSPNWTINDGPTDEHADFFFDYSTVGVPSAPNSGGSTRGMKLQANLTDGIFGGFSVSPNDKSFTGDYKLTFDLWSNYIGGDPDGIGVIGTTSGSTMLSVYGIETSGAVANRAGTTDGIFFANTGDSSSSAFRAYSAERAVSYQSPADPAVLDGLGQPIDSHATYHAGNRSNNPNSTTAPAAALYVNSFPSVQVPAAQTALFPETQHGSTVAGALGFAWHEVEIATIGNTVTWKVDGVLLITLDKTNFVTPTGGTNIFFGHGDINEFISQDPYYDDVSFTLIDNVSVSAVTAAANNADFNNDNVVDGADFLIWQKGLGLTGQTDKTNGNANDDQVVDAADLAVWASKFGGAPAVGAVSAVPEPATWALGLVAVLVCAAIAMPRRRRRQLAPVRVK